MPRDNKMAKKMSFYPEFVPNQVLTDTQLNQLREYLDEQTRSTRVRLIGTGIVCGLESVITDTRIQISQGYGVSSGRLFARVGGDGLRPLSSLHGPRCAGDRKRATRTNPASLPTSPGDVPARARGRSTSSNL